MQAEDERRERLDYVGWGEKKSTRTPCPKRTFDEKSTRNRGNSRKKKQHCDGVACSTILCHMLRTRRGGGLYIFRFRGDEIAFCDIAAAAAAAAAAQHAVSKPVVSKNICNPLKLYLLFLGENLKIILLYELETRCWYFLHNSG